MRYQAPDVLKARIRASVANPEPEVATKKVAVPLFRVISWPSMIAAGVAVAVLSSALTIRLTHRQTADPVEQEVLASHIRSLIPGHLTDVASNDQHNVKPWFNGRVNMSPDVPRLDSLGYTLVGGRVDYIDGRNVPVVVYTRRQHVINVFSWPAPGVVDSRHITRGNHGYNLIQANHNGEEVWIVSDLNLSELRDFTRLLIPAS
jgi:anti-sigma factor RsiW